jgi:hypothetical protein
MNFSVGLPFKYLPGGGVKGLVYNEKNNLLDNYGNLQGLIASSYIGLYTAKAFLSTASSAGKMLGISWDLESRSSVDTLIKVTRTAGEIADELFIGTPTRVLQFMHGSDAYLAYKTSKVMHSRSAQGIRNTDIPNALDSPALKRGKVIGSILGKSVLGATLGWMAGAFIGSLQGKQGSAEFGSAAFGSFVVGSAYEPIIQDSYICLG